MTYKDEVKKEIDQCLITVQRAVEGEYINLRAILFRHLKGMAVTEGTYPAWAQTFIDDLNKFYKTTGYITARQVFALSQVLTSVVEGTPTEYTRKLLLKPMQFQLNQRREKEGEEWRDIEI